MRLLNEKTVARLCQTRRSTREGYLLYHRQEHCTQCQLSCRTLKQDRKVGATSRPKHHYFRLCGNLLYCLPADHASVESSQKLPESVLILQGHVVEPVEEEQVDSDSNSGDEVLQQQQLQSDGQPPDSTFQIFWPSTPSSPHSEASAVSDRCPGCYGAINRYLFTAPSTEEAALWIRALLVASSECAKFACEELRDQLQLISEGGEISQEFGAAAKEANSEALIVPVAPQDPADADCCLGDSLATPTRWNPFSCDYETC